MWVGGEGGGGGVRVLTMSNETCIVCSVSVRAGFREWHLFPLFHNEQNTERNLQSILLTMRNSAENSHGCEGLINFSLSF